MDKVMLSNLSAAISNGRTDIVRSLINVCEKDTTNPDIVFEDMLNEICNPSGTLLHLATKLDYVDIVRTLLSSGADPTAQNEMGETPYDLVQSQKMTAVYVDELLKCAAKSEIIRIRRLIIAGVDIDGEDSPESGNRALHWAVCFGKSEAVKCLLDLGASPNIMNGDGATPLHEAVNRKNCEIIKILLMSGADSAVKSLKGKYMGKTPLDLCEESQEVLNMFLEHARCNSEHGKNDLNFTQENFVSSTINDSLSESLQSLSVVSEKSTKQNSGCMVQPLHVPPFLLTPLPLITDSKLHLLWPQPQKIFQTDGKFFKLDQKLSVHIVKSDLKMLNCLFDLWAVHCERFKSFGVECHIEDIIEPEMCNQGAIICYINPQLFSKQESYKLIITDQQIQIIFPDVFGLHYALCTLGQLFCLYYEDGLLPTLYIHDWPQFHHRAVLLDFSQGARKPTLDTLKSYIEIMSFLKLRQLHCFFRYEFRDENSLPFSNKTLLDLSRHCNKYLISITPVIDVDIGVEYCDIKDISQPINHLVSLFASKEVHIGPNLSKLMLSELLQSKNSKVFSDLLMLQSSNLGLIFLCCNGIHFSSDLLSLLPLNCALIDYGSQLEHDFDSNAKILTLAGFNVCIGTGTASWGSVAGCPESAVSCIHKASMAAYQHGLCGLLVADWKTLPHHPASCFSWPGIILGVGMAWNCSIHEDYLHARLPELLNHYVYQDSAQVMGYLNVELGRLEAFFHQSVSQKSQINAVAKPNVSQSSVLHQLLLDPDSVALENFTLDLIQQVIRHLKKFELELQKAKPTCYQNGEYISEFRLAMDLLLFACKLGKVMVASGLNPSQNSCGLAVINVGISNLPPIARTDLANRLLALTEQFRAVWLSRNLPCGLQTSLCIFNSLLHKLIPNTSHSLLSVDEELPSFKESNSCDNVHR